MRRLNLGPGGDFARELAVLGRRITRIKALQSGDADYEVVSVAETIVRRHVRAAHQRVVIKMRKDVRGVARDRRQQRHRLQQDASAARGASSRNQGKSK